MVNPTSSGAFNILRYFSIASLVSIVIVAALLAILYRHLAINAIIGVGQRSNLSLAQTVFNSVRPQLVDYLTSVATVDGQDIGSHPLAPELLQAIYDVKQNTAVARIKIYNKRGTVVFSTKHDQVGRDQSDNPGWISAVSGTVVSELIYRDTFNRFDKATEEDNLMQTYIPVRLGFTDPIQGVFEIYTNVEPLVRRTARSQIVAITAVATLMLILYGFLLTIVRRAARMVERQQLTIEERTQTLQLLSAQLLSVQESERKHIADELHEGLAQTLSATKLQLEEAATRIRDNTHSGDAKPLEKAVPVVQSAIQEVRKIAMNLRPPSLDDFGLITTLGWFCRELQSIYSATDIDTEIHLEEQDIPNPLKVVIYRIVQEALNDIIQNTESDRIRVELRRVENGLALTIEDSGRVHGPESTQSGQGSKRNIGLATIKERTTLSGGSFVAESNGWGGTTIRASWPTLQQPSIG